MCAINGFNWENKEYIEKMNQCLKHRGPDGTGVFLNSDISLGHNRLSILDTRSIANQPMKSDDGRFIIVFNGEIYNFNEIKDEMKSEYDFVTTGDTEVILAAYKKWGKECVSRFNGMFAFAIWDNLEMSLFIARDPIGIKPLYYYWDGDKFIFSSEIKAILEHPIDRTLNKEAFAHYMRILYVPEPFTLFNNINKLPPSNYLYLKDKKMTINKYNPYKNIENNSINSKELREVIYESVKRQLISDRPLGIYLSGGIDSTTVLQAVSTFRKDIITFSVGFELDKDEQADKFNMDMLLARTTAQIYKTQHNEIFVKKNEIIPLLEEAIYHLDEPISNPTIIPMIKLARFAKQRVAVVLGGDGGDELFGGYERYKISLLSVYYQTIPKFIREYINSSKLLKLNTKKGIDQFELFMFQKDKELFRVISRDFKLEPSKKFFEKKYFDNLNKSGPELLMETDQKSWLVDESLMRSDKTSMASGLELRVPLLDLELFEYSRKIPLNKKINLFNTKVLLKESMKLLLPKYLFKQPKRGWFSPGAKWLRDPEISKYVRNIFSDKYYQPTAEIFNWGEINDIYDKHLSKDSYHFTMLWAIITFQIWARTYKINIK